MVRVLEVFGRLDRGGAETLVMELYRHMDRSLIQMDFVKHTTDRGLYEDEIESLGGRIYSVPRYAIWNKRSYKSAWNNLFKQHPEWKIVHGHMPTTAGIYLREAKRYGIKTIAHAHQDTYGPGLLAKIKEISSRSIRGSADRYLACSEAAGRFYFGDDLLNSKRYQFFPNGIDINKFLFDELKRKAVREKLGIPSDVVLVGTVGRLTFQKNPFGILDICSCLFASEERREKYKFIWTGTGELEDKIKTEVRKRGLSENVMFTGVRSDVEAVLSAMDVFVFPSIWEGLGIAAVEAQANGLPVLASDVITREVSVTGRVEFLPLSDYCQWAKRIVRVDKTRQDDRDKIREAGFDISDCTKRLSDLYMGLIR